MDIYSVVITRQSNPHISKFKSPCNEFWSMFPWNTHTKIFSKWVQPMSLRSL